MELPAPAWTLVVTLLAPAWALVLEQASLLAEPQVPLPVAL